MAGARPSTPASESELLARAHGLAGLTLGRIAADAGFETPVDQRRLKGWVGAIIEWCLGADATSRPEPDFRALGVELKTLPLNHLGRPAESTYVCVVPLAGEMGEWKLSNVYRKLARVLWVPVEAERSVPLRHRRVGEAFLWSPDAEEERSLRSDWEELTEMIARDGLDRLSARHGRCLQIRPKAAHAGILTRLASPEGAAVLSNPRGFYLRAGFTGRVLAVRRKRDTAPRTGI